ncbi:oxidoreductase [Flavobacterium sp. SUN046]|uniref:WD40/YVTN/BNR-like repeat-containing protein n=1 Tax=Flavobacterium sp. SUN046 TaxID=3002440 RepID=UPI002DB67AF6|nr:oxidoreductase [Flavobacterium sp. SUN046]MEC4048648.1 oxidoreductase [Flavobacterium sp. SUN046]
MFPKIICTTFLLFFLVSCKSNFKNDSKSTLKVQTDTLLIDQISIRAIAIDKNILYYAANKNRVGFIDLTNGKKFERALKKDSLNLEFRSLAITKEAVFVLSIANPALLYRFSKDLISKKLVYEEHHEKVFYDAMQFWNNSDGIALGDPIDGTFSLLLTHDGGQSWNKVPSIDAPKAKEGEAVFAASNSNIILKNKEAWFVTGGHKARVFHSLDNFLSWNIQDTPIIQGSTMTGIFTADFYNEKIGIVSGGNYDKPEQNATNKAITTNGGKSWKLISDNAAFGYASCIQFVPESKGKALMSVGATGVFYSNDKGTTWTQISKDNSFYTIRFMDNHTAIAAGKNKIVRIRF